MDEIVKIKLIDAYIISSTRPTCFSIGVFFNYDI